MAQLDQGEIRDQYIQQFAIAVIEKLIHKLRSMGLDEQADQFQARLTQLPPQFQKTD